MTIKKSITSKAVFGYAGINPSRQFAEFVEKAQPAGIILFERNLSTLAELKSTLKDLKILSPQSLFMIDEEGGIKSRLRAEHGFPNPPNPREIPRAMTPSGAREIYRIAGEALKDLGIDVDLAPVADVAPAYHILGDRSFSENAEICADYVAAAVEGLSIAGIRSCAKHFPGLGTADIDPHLGISVAREDAEFEQHFLPFKAAVKAGVSYIMTTHLRAASLDESNTIATFSQNIVNIIRFELGFRGQILTDDLFMEGAIYGQNLEDRAIAAIRAGHDILLICRELSEGEYLRMGAVSK